jgi:hypothetical protein
MRLDLRVDSEIRAFKVIVIFAKLQAFLRGQAAPESKILRMVPKGSGSAHPSFRMDFGAQDHFYAVMSEISRELAAEGYSKEAIQNYEICMEVWIRDDGTITDVVPWV